SFNIKNLRKGDIDSLVKEVTLNQIVIEKVGNNAYVIQKPTAASVNQESTLVNTISNTVQQTLSGTVIDANTNTPLSGVTVRVKGGSQSTQTDANGRFFVEGVPSNVTLIISSVGYNVVEIAASNNQTIRLTADDQSLEEVVVTALGIKREQKALGYAVQDIKGDQLQKVKGVDIGTTLTGRI